MTNLKGSNCTFWNPHCNTTNWSSARFFLVSWFWNIDGLSIRKSRYFVNVSCNSIVKLSVELYFQNIIYLKHRKLFFIFQQINEDANCPVAKAELDRIWNSEEILKMKEQYKELLTFLGEKFNKPDLQLQDLWIVYDNLFCQVNLIFN